jgi:hypothetical protein
MISDVVGATIVFAGCFIVACVLLWQSLYTLRTGDIAWGFLSQFNVATFGRAPYEHRVEYSAGRVVYALLYGAPAVGMFVLLGWGCEAPPRCANVSSR